MIKVLVELPLIGKFTIRVRTSGPATSILQYSSERGLLKRCPHLIL